LSEKIKLQFRSEFFNFTNHTRFGLPSANVQDGAFGVINSAGSPRDIQLALKLMF
jgi:hypothetical protein